MIRILHVIGSMGCGGAEAMLMNIYRTIDRNRIQFDFVVHSNEKAFYDDEIKALGGQIYRTKRFNIINYFSYKRFWNDFYREHPEYMIVHGHINSSASIYLSIAKKNGRLAVVHSHATRNREKSLSAVAFLLFAYPIRHIAEYFFACSRQAGIDRFGKKVVGSNRFQVLNNGINVSHYVFDSDVRDKMRNEYKISSTTLIVGHVGRFTFAKNHKFLIEVFSKIQELETDSKLWLVGVGELEREIRNQVEKLNLSDKVEFIGQTDHVGDYLQAMDVFVFPSVFEGLGIAVVEAQAAGMPCVVSEAIQQEADIGGGLIKHMKLADGSNAWAREIINSKEVRHQDMSRCVKESGFDIIDSTHQLEDFYENLFHNNK